MRNKKKKGKRVHHFIYNKLKEKKWADKSIVRRDLYDSFIDQEDSEMSYESFARCYRYIIRYYKEHGEKKLYETIISSDDKELKKSTSGTSKFDPDEQTEVDSSQNVNNVSSKLVSSLEELLDTCNVDLDIWKVDRHRVNTWSTTMKDPDGEPVSVPNYQVEAKLIKRILEPVQFKPIEPIRINNINLKGLPKVEVKKVNLKKCLILGDAQISFFRPHWNSGIEPTHDRNTMELFLYAVNMYQPELIVLNGDMLDLSEFSDKFVVDPKFKGLIQPALTEYAFFIKLLKEISPESKIVYLYGNHEKRMERAILKNFSVAYDLKKVNPSSEFLEETESLMSLENLLNLKELGVEILNSYPDDALEINNNLEIVHGDRVVGKSGGTVSRIINDAVRSQIVGHIHRFEYATKTLRDRIVEIHSLGCACRTDGTVPSYKKKMNWQKGFGMIDFNEKEYFINHIKVVNDHAIYIDGTMITIEETMFKDIIKNKIKELESYGKS